MAAGVWWSTGWLAGAVAAALGAWFLPDLLGPDREHDRRVTRTAAIATWAEMLRDTLSSAAGLEQAVLATTPLAPQAIRSELGEVAAGIERGGRLAPALRELGQRLDDPVGDLVATALAVAAEQQARRLAELLGSLAEAARDHAAMRMRVAAGRARTRTTVRVIVGTTLGFTIALMILNRPYLDAFNGAQGQLVLAAVVALFATGFAWLAHTVRARPVSGEAR
ncbi:type II secretion system F family protein [Actinokineospora pegani]|uniref:type II secretion system F family protein n=1 Tax=Actinokineospora pegani TaxID=2654637 RepID=UPI001F1A5B39|nr:type II secretion system F family protein [Actinokineospora pegani]